VLSAVKQANLRLHTPIVDIMYCNLIERWEVAGYVAAPPLALFSAGVKSTLQYAEEAANLTVWERRWSGMNV
jgi:hypothetical protein